VNLREVLEVLESLANPDKVILKKEKFGIVSNNSLGIYHKQLKALSKAIGSNDHLALALFDTGIYEARLLCSKIYNPASITEKQMDQWVLTFENWEVCDSFCMGFFAKSKYALPKAIEWSQADQEFVKRAGFVIMASYGFANKNAENDVFQQFLPIIEREAADDRIYVKKAVNWALRNIGKRNIDLNASSINVAEKLTLSSNKTTKWIGVNALKELRSESANILDYPRANYR
jgi:3-methyladenine DNA glycosylase AlkD